MCRRRSVFRAALLAAVLLTFLLPVTAWAAPKNVIFIVVPPVHGLKYAGLLGILLSLIVHPHREKFHRKL